MQAVEFIPKPYALNVEHGKCSWNAPSNIALIKYWGKREFQIPANPSVSFTLDACKTTTSVEFGPRQNEESEFSFEIYFDGQHMDSFRSKIETFFNRIQIYAPFLSDFHFKIDTSNTFPHSSGIASSASGMSALALCLMSIEKLFQPEMTDDYFIRKASFLARLGSGSAARSIEGDLVVWGEHRDIPGSSDLFGIHYPLEVHDIFRNYHDTILLVDKGEKEISSSIGHNLMHDHPYAETRFQQAHNSVSRLITIFKTGDLNAFIQLIESEALTLHAMMLTSRPSYILMKPNTLEIINKIWQFRAESGLNIAFTLDAGANVHVLYPENEAVKIYEFIKTELVAYCQNGHYICDRIGFGAKQLPI